MGSAAMKELGIQMIIPAYSPQARRPNLIGSLNMCRAQERAIRNKLEILLNQIRLFNTIEIDTIHWIEAP